MLATPKKRRSNDHQQIRRNFERSMRMHAIALVRWARKLGYSIAEVADRVDIFDRTLAEWVKKFAEDGLPAKLMGKPISRTPRWLRQQLCALFGLIGPGVSIAVLQDFFPELPRCELENMRMRYLKIYKRSGYIPLHVLRWEPPGAVWAMDFFERRQLIDGIYRYVLVVRDLASGKILLSLPCICNDALTVKRALIALFKEHGTPLLIKSDNGDHFTAKLIVTLLEDLRIVHLLSPAATPEYNGACEAGIGALQCRAMLQALRHGRDFEWSCDDLWTAQQQANAEARPMGRNGPTPNEIFNDPLYRRPSRELFLKEVEASEQQTRQEFGILPDMEPDKNTQARIRRIAITRAVVARDILIIKKRRFPLPILPLRMQKVWRA